MEFCFRDWKRLHLVILDSSSQPVRLLHMSWVLFCVLGQSWYFCLLWWSLEWLGKIDLDLKFFLFYYIITIFFIRYSATEYIKRQEITTLNIELDDARGYKRRMDSYSGSDKWLMYFCLNTRFLYSFWELYLLFCAFLYATGYLTHKRFNNLLAFFFHMCHPVLD